MPRFVAPLTSEHFRNGLIRAVRTGVAGVGRPCRGAVRFGNVVIVTNDGKRLTSPQLKYVQGLNEVSSDTSFTLIRPGQTLSGVGFRGDPQLTRYTILKAGASRGSLLLPPQ